MTLSHPHALWALLLLLPYAWWRLSRTAPAVPWGSLQVAAGDAPAAGARPRRWPVVLELVLMTGSVACLAGPAWVDQLELLGEEGIDVGLVLDVSASMQAADFPPSRLAALQELAIDFVRRSAADRILVVAFAGRAFTQTPLTTDHRVLEELIGALAFESLDHGRSGGTAVGDALLLAADSLLRQREEGRSQVALLFSDGESHLGVDPVLAARHLAEQGIGLHVVGLGGDEPVKVSVHGEPFVTSQGTVLETRLDDEQLQSVAAEAAGSYHRAGSRDVLTTILASLGRLERSPLEVEVVTLRRPLAPIVARVLLAVALCWLFAEGWLGRRPLR